MLVSEKKAQYIHTHTSALQLLLHEKGQLLACKSPASVGDSTFMFIARLRASSMQYSLMMLLDRLL